MPKADGDGRVLGPYRLESQLAVGGMAEIYVAKTAGVGGFEKLVALKLIHPNYSEDPQFVQMLVDEAKLAVQLTHANIVQTFDLGRVDDQYYIAMELIDGVDLYKLLRTASEKDLDFPFELAAFIALETSNGLDYAHRKRDSKGRPLEIVHRDVSPQNILVSNDGEVKIVDFGIAKAALRGKRTAAGVIKGKYYYMSPEQAWGDPIDARSDVFSTGILLYEMLVGQMLYLEEDLETLLDKVRKAQIPPPTTLRKGIPAPLEAIVMRALKKRPQERFQSAGEMSLALTEWLRSAAPDFNRARLSQFVGQVMGDAAEVTSTHRDPSVSTALTREMLARDENSLLFRLEDLRPEAASPPKAAPAPAPKPQPPSKARGRDQATAPVSLPEMKRALDDFAESDQTIVDSSSSTLLATPQVDPVSSPGTNPDATRPMVGPDLLRGKARAAPAPSSFEEDEQTIINPPEIATPAAPARPSQEHPTARMERPKEIPLAELKPPDSAPVAVDENDEITGVDEDDEATGQHRPAPPRLQAPLPSGNAGKPTLAMKRSAQAKDPDLMETGPARPPPGLVPPAPAPAPAPSVPQMSSFDEPTRLPPPAPAFPSGMHPVQGAWPFTQSGEARVLGDAPAEGPGSTALVPKQGRPLLIVVIALAVVALAIGLALLLSSTGPQRGSIEVVSLPARAEVRLDGTLVPRPTPLEITDVDAQNSHHVRVSLPGYDAWESDVRFDASTLKVRLQAVLVPTVGTLELTSVPPGAEAIVNGRIRGITPTTVADLPPGDDVNIELRLRGFKVAHSTVSWQGKRKLAVTIPLEKAK